MENNLPTSTNDIMKLQSFTSTNSPSSTTPTKLIDKIEEAHQISKALKEFENSIVSPLLTNSSLLSIAPTFDSKINYYVELVKFQSFYQIESSAYANLYKMVEDLQNSIHKIQEQVTRCKASPRKFIHRKNRRTAVEINREFNCPYQNCFKSYGSDVSLNLHIKIKHGGGNKTQRQKVALEICQAQNKGQQLLASSIIFPPGYLQEYRKKFIGKIGTISI